MTPEKLVRLTVIVALLNFAMTSTLLFGRPDLAVRESSEKIFQTAMALEKEGKFEEAASLYETIFYDMATTLIAPRAGERLADICRRYLLDVDKARKVLKEASEFKGSAYREVALKDLAFLETHWGQDGAALKIYYESSAAFRAGDKPKALDLLNKILKEHPDSTLKPVCMVRAAKLFKEMNRKEEAAKVLRDYLTAFPKDTDVAEARNLLRTVQ